MMEFFKVFRLGIVNLLGVTFPGLLVLFFTTYGLALPLLGITLQLNDALGRTQASPTWQAIAGLCEANKTTLAVVLLIAAYVVGYVIRLHSIDDLDRKSARRVLQQWATPDDPAGTKRAEADSWVTRMQENDRFPYYHFREYLEARGLSNLASLVTWDSTDTKPNKRTKAVVNMMKLEISQKCPDLSANIESNEAHVRLLFGTWRAIHTCLPVVLFGALLSLAGFTGAFSQIPRLPEPHGLYSVWFVTDILLLIGMIWIRRIIQKLFHYQRVRELTYILGCFWYVRAGGQVAKRLDMGASPTTGSCPTS